MNLKAENSSNDNIAHINYTKNDELMNDNGDTGENEKIEIVIDLNKIIGTKSPMEMDNPAEGQINDKEDNTTDKMEFGYAQELYCEQKIIIGCMLGEFNKIPVANPFNCLIATGHMFIQKVFKLLALHLLLIAGFIILCLYVSSIKKVLQNDSIIWICALVLFIITYIILMVHKLRRRSPLNLIILGLWTLSFAFLMATVSVKYLTVAIWACMLIIAAICFLIFILALEQSLDVTYWVMYLVIATIIVTTFGFIVMVVTILGVKNVNLSHMAIASIASLLFCWYLIYETRQIIFGRRMKLCEHESICGVITLYADILCIFCDCLRLINYRSK